MDKGKLKHIIIFQYLEFGNIREYPYMFYSFSYKMIWNIDLGAFMYYLSVSKVWSVILNVTQVKTAIYRFTFHIYNFRKM